MNEAELTFDTRVVHAGRLYPRIQGAAVTPIFQCAVWEHAEEGASYLDVRYPRMQNLPNHQVLAAKLASLEGGERAEVAASGMAAITATLLAVLGDGGHMLAQDQLYGGTHAFVAHDLRRFGIGHDFIGSDAPDAWRKKLKANTRAIYVETMSNPLMRVIDHRAVVAFAREHDLVAIIDNTFATPVNFRPLSLGYDVVVHSCTKYLNGHSDQLAGAVIGSSERIGAIHELLSHLGGSLDPHGCFLLERGLKTLALRVRAQNANAEILTGRLEQHPAVARVNYPALASHPDHGRARELFEGSGGMLSLELEGGPAAARRFCDTVRIPINGPSLGGVETLVTRPATTSHASLGRAERERLGITDGLIRISVGIESADDLWRDFEAALG